MLRYLPVEMRAADLQPVTSTINSQFGVVCEFFETDDSLRTHNVFEASVLCDSQTIVGESCQ